ncbi:hypothetical protein [Bifidobacterium miconisargentati]|uniref:hypothetical protein n=1 Tax=Bifidobacterium miconisargentati TaxID=2834437 RepID=UPI001BDBEA20|nr:hypothetical protein [Bifidobacterium miconisargentati]MBW3090162.1 hypothetical protein [Bifidobacterium miconisargentati]
MTMGDRVFLLLDKAFTGLGQVTGIIARVASGKASADERVRWDAAKGPLAVAAKAAVIVVCVLALAWLGTVAYRLGGQSVVVKDTPQYQKASQNLKWANVDLMESEQDVANRQKQIKQANAIIDQAKQDREKYGNIVDEIQQAQKQNKDPALTVTAIGDPTQSYLYYETPITVHNNTQQAYSSVDVYFQAVDGDGNVLHSAYAMGESETTCEPNADCALSIFDDFNPSGSKLMPTYWGVTATGGSSEYGRYGVDAMSKQF